MTMLKGWQNEYLQEIITATFSIKDKLRWLNRASAALIVEQLCMVKMLCKVVLSDYSNHCAGQCHGAIVLHYLGPYTSICH